MFPNITKAEKITLCVIVTVFVYGIFTFFFSFGAIIADPSIQTFSVCLPYYAQWKLLLCLAVALLILAQGDGLDNISPEQSAMASTVKHGLQPNPKSRRLIGKSGRVLKRSSALLLKGLKNTVTG